MPRLGAPGAPGAPRRTRRASAESPRTATRTAAPPRRAGGPGDRGGVQRNLVSAGPKQRVHVRARPHAAAHGERDEHLLSGAPHHVVHGCLPPLEAVMSRNVSSSAPSEWSSPASSTGWPTCRRSRKCTPLTTRPPSTSRPGMTRTATVKCCRPCLARPGEWHQEEARSRPAPPRPRPGELPVRDHLDLDEQPRVDQRGHLDHGGGRRGLLEGQPVRLPGLRPPGDVGDVDPVCTTSARLAPTARAPRSRSAAPARSASPCRRRRRPCRPSSRCTR